MSQESVYKLLEKSKKPMSIPELSSKLNLSKSCVSNSLRKMLKYHEISKKTELIKKKINTVRVQLFFVGSKIC